jgi:hypothetical protein
MMTPVGATIERTEIASAATIQITPEDRTWILNIQTPRTTNPDLTAADLADQIVLQLARAAGDIFIPDQRNPGRKERIGAVGEFIEPRTTILINDRPAERVYVVAPVRGSDPPRMRGYTVFKISPTQFVTFELIATRAMEQAARTAYETILATATFDDPSAAAAERAAGIRAGLELMRTIDEPALRDLAQSHGERWERLFRPAPTGADADAQEIAYRRIRVSEGTRGEVSRSSTAGGDRERGIVVRIDARGLDGDRIIDSESIFFVNYARTVEVWSVRNAVRQRETTPPARRDRLANAAPARPLTFTEIGGRTGTAMTVRIEGTGQSPQTIQPILEGDGYVSRVEGYLLPFILARSRIPLDYAFYAYQSDSATIRLRRDSLSESPDRPGLWRVVTRLGEDRGSQTTLLNEQGALIRTELPDGSIWEPTTLPRLESLWRSKGLPLN